MVLLFVARTRHFPLFLPTHPREDHHHSHHSPSSPSCYHHLCRYERLDMAEVPSTVRAVVRSLNREMRRGVSQRRAYAYFSNTLTCFLALLVTQPKIQYHSKKRAPTSIHSSPRTERFCLDSRPNKAIGESEQSHHQHSSSWRITS